MASPEEAEPAIAGILLVKAGHRSVAPVSRRLAEGRGPSELFDVPVSIGTDSARAALRLLSAGGRSEVAAAARQALTKLDEMNDHEVY